MSILLTGACGYIGSHIAIELLQQNFSVIIVDNLSNSSQQIINTINKITNKKLFFYQNDVSNEKSLDNIFSNHNIISVIHLASLKSVNESIKNPIYYYENNIRSTLSLIKIMKKYRCYNLIFSSSATVYGNASTPLSEDSQIGIGITNPYGKTKLMIEEILSDLTVSDSQWNIMALRYFNPVGSHSSALIGDDPLNPTNLMPIIISASIQHNHNIILKDNNILNIYGDDYDTPDGTALRDYIHVVDLAKAHLKSLQKIKDFKGYNVFNLGMGKGISVLNMITTFEMINKVKVPYQLSNRREGDVPISYTLTEKANNILEWYPELTLEDMCRDSWKYAKFKYKLK